MKKTCLFLFLAAALTRTASADIIAQWNFNSDPPDGSTGTGTDLPSIGSASISVIGTTLQGTGTANYSSGNGSTDPASSDDSAYHTRNYPVQGEANKTSGIQVNVSTVGFENIIVTWDQQNSATANKYLRFQYSLDGSTFVDYVVLTMSAATTFVNDRTVNLGPILGANENPNFAFRLVSEFEDTATGSGTIGYAATGGGTYSTNGTMRFDMLTISGSVPDGNAFPMISSIPDQTTRVDIQTDPLPFQVSDAETPAEELIVTGTSSNTDLVPDSGLFFEGTGANRTVVVVPNYDLTGRTTITLYVIDGGGKSNSTSFLLTVLPNNTPPALATFTNYHTIADTPFAPISFTFSDAESPASALTVVASSSNQDLIPDANLALSGTEGSRTLDITPAAGQSGTAAISVTVSDPEGLSTTRVFNAMIVPSANVVLTEPFGYADGSLTTNSGGLWVTRAGTPNQMQVAAGIVYMSGFSPNDEDVVAQLIGGPYAASSGKVLYASFDVTFSALPGAAPDIFAHFSGTNPNDLRARVVSSTQNAAPGFFRLGVGNTTSGATTVMDYPLDLALGTTYQVIVGYNLAAGTSTLWVNPASGGAPVGAIDGVSPISIDSFGWRQSTRIGQMTIDNLLVGLSFEDVTPNLTRVRIRKSGTSIQVYWPSDSVWEGYFLERTRDLANPDWQFVNDPVISEDGWDIVTITNPAGNEFYRLRKN